MLSRIGFYASSHVLLSYTSQAKIVSLKLRLQASPESQDTLFQIASNLKKQGHQPINTCVLTDLQIELQKDREKSFQALKTTEQELKWAIQNNDVLLLKALLKEGVAVDHDEIEKGLVILNKETKDILSSKKRADQKINGTPPIVQAALDGDIDKVKKLIDAYCDINAKDYNGRTALMLAAEKGHHFIATLLLQQKADSNLGDNKRYTALMIAADQGHTKIVEILLQNGADPNLAAEDGSTAFLIAAERGNLEIVNLLLQTETKLSNVQKALSLAKQNGHTAVINLIEKSIEEPSIKKSSTQIKSHPVSSSDVFSFCEVESFEEYLQRTAYISKNPPSGVTLPLKTTQKLSILELEKATKIPEPEKKSKPTYHSFILAAGATLTATTSAIAYYFHQEKSLLNAILQNQDIDAFKILWIRTVSSQTRQTLTSFLLENPLFVLNFFSQNIELLNQKHWQTFSELFFDHENHLHPTFSTQLDHTLLTLNSELLTSLYLKIANTSPKKLSGIHFRNIILDKYLEHLSSEPEQSQTLNFIFENLFNSLTPFNQQTISHLEHMFRLLSIQPSENDDPSEIQANFLKKVCDFYSNKHPLAIERVFFETLFSNHLPQLNKAIFANLIGEDAQLEDPRSLTPIQLDALNQELILSTPLKQVFRSQRDIQNPCDFYNSVHTIFPTHYPTNADLINAIRHHHQNPQPMPTTIQIYADAQHSQNQLMIINRPHETLLPALIALFNEL